MDSDYSNMFKLFHETLGYQVTEVDLYVENPEKTIDQTFSSLSIRDKRTLLIVYYVGHGAIDETTHMFHLCTHSASPPQPQ